MSRMDEDDAGPDSAGGKDDEMARYSKALTPLAMGRFVEALEAGALVEAAAAAAGVAVSTLYFRRERDAAFAEAWDAAVARSSGPVLVFCRSKRRYQKQRARRVRFDDKRKQVFLDRFAGSCNLAAAAEEAGVSSDTVHKHLRADASFAAAFDEALRLGYTLLEAETLGQHRADLEKFRVAPAPDALKDQSFERSMKLLAYYRRRDGGIGPRPVENRWRKWTFDEAIVLLEKRLEKFGALPKVIDPETALPVHPLLPWVNRYDEEAARSSGPG